MLTCRLPSPMWPYQHTSSRGRRRRRRDSPRRRTPACDEIFTETSFLYGWNGARLSEMPSRSCQRSCGLCVALADDRIRHPARVDAGFERGGRRLERRGIELGERVERRPAARRGASACGARSPSRARARRRTRTRTGARPAAGARARSADRGSARHGHHHHDLRLGCRGEADVRFDDEAERAFRADEELAQVVARSRS